MATKRIEYFFDSNKLILEEIGVNYNDFLKYKEKTNLTENDAVWSFFNSLIVNVSEEKRYLKLNNIYFLMVFFRRKVEGVKANNIYKIYNDYNIRHQINSFPSERLEAEFSVIFGDCKECSNIKKTKYSIDEALKNDFIPYSECKRLAGCVCMFCITVKRDVNGDIIRKDDW